VDIQIETITPQKAEQWLATKALNRSLSKQTIDRYTIAIKAGEWEQNGEAIKFNTEGQLIDGQHRLSAVKRAGQSIRSVVIRNLNGRSFETFDTGKGRSIPDVLSIYGYKNPLVLAGAARFLYLHKHTGGAMRTNVASHHVTSLNIVSFLNENTARRETLIQAAKEGLNRHVRATFWRPAMIGYLWAVTNIADRAIADEFWASFNTELRPDHPVNKLSERIAKDRLSKQHMSNEEGLAISIKAWNAFATNTPVAHTLRYRMFGPKAETLPEVHGLNLEAI
jgi:hypothetical protein